MAAADGSQYEIAELGRQSLTPLLYVDGQHRQMRSPSYFMDEELTHPLVVDLYAGHGGASLGLASALQRPVDIAANHKASALAVHAANSPRTKHYIEDIYDVDPIEATKGRPVGLLWASPDCTHHSRARGAAPIRRQDKKSRGLAAVVINWAKLTRPYCLLGENVCEFREWGPTMAKRDEHGRHMTDKYGNKLFVPDPTRAGTHFKRWVRALERLGYSIQFFEIKAADAGAPTIRRRLYWVAKLGGKIRAPELTHGPGRAQPYRTTAECIDWSVPPQSIFDRPKPLEPNSLRRIATGVVRHVIKNPKPYIVPGSMREDPIRNEQTLQLPHIVKYRGDSSGFSVEEPLHTITSGAGADRPAGAAHAMGLIATEVRAVRSQVATVVKYYSSGGQDQDVAGPAHTITAKARLGLVQAEVTCAAAFMAQHNGGWCETDARPITEPLSAVTCKGSQQTLVTAHLTNYYTSNTGGGEGRLDEPSRVITAGGQHQALVQVELSPEDEAKARRCAEFLRRYYKPSSKDDPELVARVNEGIVRINSMDLSITDIAQRMLTPRELASCQSMPRDYVIDPECWYRTRSGRMKYGRLPQHEQIAGIGNSVCPVVAEALVRANYSDDMSTWYPEQQMAA